MNTNPEMGVADLEKLIIQNVSRDALMAFEDAYEHGDAKGRAHSSNFSKGHRPSAAGHNKHFFINEAFHEALQASGAEPTPLRGTRLVIGRLGMFNLARLNVPSHKWVNLRRSTTRKNLAEVNLEIKRKYIQRDFFSDEDEPNAGTIFILGVMDGSDANGITQLTQVMLALPAPDLKSWLYIKPVSDFLQLYTQDSPAIQQDNALPKLKATQKKKNVND